MDYLLRCGGHVAIGIERLTMAGSTGYYIAARDVGDTFSVYESLSAVCADAQDQGSAEAAGRSDLRPRKGQDDCTRGQSRVIHFKCNDLLVDIYAECPDPVLRDLFPTL